MAMQPTFDEAAWDDAVSRLDAAREALAAGAFEAARADAAAITAELSAVVGPEHPDTAAAIMVEGEALAALGRLDDGMVAFRRALAIFDCYTAPGEVEVVRPLRVDALQRIGQRLALDGRYDEAITLQREALAEASVLHGPDGLEVAAAWNALGVALRFAARYDEAAAAYARAAALRAAHGEPDPAVHHHNLSGLASARGDFAAAEVHARAAVARRREDGDDFELATDLCGLGDALAGLGRLGDAEAAYREALALFARTAPDHAEVAYALHNLADTLADRGRAAEAEATYRDAIARKTRVLGPTHHELAPSLNNLAHLLDRNGRRAEAREASRQAVAIAAALPPDHPVRTGCEALAAELGA